MTLAPPNFTLSVAPPALTIVQGGSDESVVTINRTNFTGAVTFGINAAPGGVSGSFAPSSTTSDGSIVTITVGAAVTPGTYGVEISGSGTPGVRSTILSLTVVSGPDYTMAVAPESLTIANNGTGNATVTITRTNFTGPVTLSLGGAPAGVTGVFVPAAPTGTTSTLTISVGAAVTPGTYNLTVDATATPRNRSEPLTLTVVPQPNFILDASPDTLTIVQGNSDGTIIGIARINFTGAVTLSLGAAPAGVTGVFAPPAPTGSSSTLTVSLGGAVTPGTYNLTVDGTGTPGSRSTPLVVIVTATPNYTLSANPSSLTIAQNANANTGVTITRTNFTGAVTLSLTGAPAGVTGSFAPAAPTGTSSTLTVSVGGAVGAGVYNLTVSGTGTPGIRTTPLTLTVTGGGGGNNVTVSFANCAVADRAVWLAAQDGNGAWTRVVGAGDVYTFAVTSGTGGVAWVVLGAGNESSVQVQYMTQAELTAGTLDFCGAALPAGRTFTGTATNFGDFGLVYASLGGGVGTAQAGLPGFTITGVQDGTHDLVGFMSDFVTPGAERGLLRRDIVVSGDGSVGTVDFTGGESFAAASATMTLVGLTGGETIFQNISYLVTAQCVPAPLGIGGTGAASFTAYGIPVAPQRATDFHQMAIIAADGSNVRTATESFHTFGNRTVTLGSALSAPTVTPLAGPYKRLQAVFTVPGEYSGGASTFGYVDASADKTVNLSATPGYRGGPGITLALADFSGLAGWDNNWAPAAAATGDWTATGSGAAGGSACVENATQRSAARGGTF